MLQRVIFHADCNSFFASVELLAYPELKDKPVAVSGSVDDRHGIILAKNEVAKKYNIQTAENVWKAKQKCPDLILLSPHRNKYTYYSKVINEIYASYSDRVEPFGIDESWLDMTGSWQLFGKTPVETANRLRKEVQEKTGLTISIGVSFNKVFAKLGSDYKKPNATTELTKENFKQIVWPLPVNTLLFVGKKAEQSLKELKIQNIGQLAAADTEVLTSTLGKLGKQLQIYALGEDEAPVLRADEQEPIKSVGNGLTFKRNLSGEKDIKTAVVSLADEVAGRLRRYNLYASSLQVIIKNPNFKTISRQKPLSFSTNLAKDLVQTAMELIKDNWDLKNPIRMLTITAQHLTEEPFVVQTSFLEPEKKMNPKRKSLEESIDKIREKYGKTSVLQGGQIHNDIGVKSIAQTEENEDLDE